LSKRLERVVSPALTFKVPVKLAAEEIVWPLIKPELIVPAVSAPMLPFVEKRLVVEAVVEKKFVVVALVVVELPIVTPPTKVVEAAVQTLELLRLSEAMTLPVVGEMVRVPSTLATEVTDPEPVPQAEPIEKTLPVESTWRQPAPVAT
jgi:hypothetical protein